MKTRIRWASFAVCVLVGSVVLSLSLIPVIRKNTSNAQKTTTAQPGNNNGITSKWEKTYANLPIGFEENRGQAEREVRFVAHGAGYALALTPQGADITLLRRKAISASPLHRAAALRALRAARKSQQTTAIHMQLDGANQAAEIAGVEKQQGKANYFVGSDPKKWITDVPSYARVKYSGIYSGVDLVYYGNQHQLEYDFVVAPGADPSAIRFKVDGAQKLAIASDGDLVLSVPDGAVEFKKPVIYQTAGNERREIAGNYALSSDNRVTFTVANYDKTLPLVIDPLLSYSTYLGGTSDETGFGIAVDAAGDAFVAGSTSSTNFPIRAGNAFQLTTTPMCSFLTEINPAGSTVLYSTYLCGTSGLDEAFAVAVDAGGKVYVTGTTSSTDFPTLNGLTSPTTNPVGAAFLSKFDPAASGDASLLYSSYVGGTAGDFANAVAADGSGNAYIGGQTFSSPGAAGSGDFTVTSGAFQATPSNAVGTAFLVRIDTTQAGNASLIYATYLGGNAANNANFLGFGEQISGVAVDGAKNAYVTGVTSSTDFPSFNGLPGTPIAANTNGAGFVSKIDTTRTTQADLTYSTYLEGSAFDSGFAIALGPSNVAYVTGSTDSTDFPTTTGAFQTTTTGSGVPFVSLIDTTLTGTPSLKYSTFFGGTGSDNGFGIQADGDGAAYIVGTTASHDFPITPGVVPATLPNANGTPFVAKLNPGGNGTADRVYATYFGGSGDGSNADQGFAIAIDANKNAYVTGSTGSATSVATAGAFQTALAGTSDAFVAKLPLILPVIVSPTSLAFGTQLVGATTAPQIVTLTNNNATTLTINSIAVVATAPPAAATDYAILSKTCGATLAAGASCTVDVTFTPSVAGAESAKLVFTDVDSSSPQSVTLTGTGTANAPVVVLTPTTLTFAGQLVTSTSAAQTVTLKNNGNLTLNIASITASGDFAVSNPCGATLAAGASCMPSVTFKPTATGSRTGTLTVTDDANGSPQTVALTGTGTDYTVTAPSSVTVSRHSSQMFNVTVTPISGFNQAVALACTGAPANTTCTIAGSPVTPDGVNPITAAVTVTSTSLVPSAPTRTPPPSGRQIILVAMGLALLAMIFATQRLRTRLSLAGAMLVVFAVAGCGGGHKPITTNITITGASNGVSHSAVVALTVD